MPAVPTTVCQTEAPIWECACIPTLDGGGYVQIENVARVGGVECSLNLFDQASRDERRPRAVQQGIGVIAKRPLGNAPWRFAERPAGDYCETYWDRMQRLTYDTAGLAWDEFALRFSAWCPEVSCAIVGTSSITHLRHNVALVEKGPLPADVVVELRRRFQAIGPDWRGEV